MSIQPSPDMHDLVSLDERRPQDALDPYAPRNPMTQLPDEYRVTSSNPNPPLVHFAVPIFLDAIYSYAERHGLPNFPSCLCFSTFNEVVRHLSKAIDYQIYYAFPFDRTRDCDLLLGLYNNYTMTRKKKPIEEDEQHVIEMLREALVLDEFVIPKWYFDADDPWAPGCA